MSTQVVILAAGQGTRMMSALPKVLHPLAGKPMLFHLLDTALSLDSAKVSVVVGKHSAEVVQSCQAHYSNDLITFVEQTEQLGTAHAVAQVVPNIKPDDKVLVLYGDVPLIQRQTLVQLIAQLGKAALSLLTVTLSEPEGYGRICRDSHGCVEKIVEEKDADADIREIQEVNTGIMAVSGECLLNNISKISNDNAQKEFYLTDLVSFCVEADAMVLTSKASSMDDVVGINNRAQLATAERIFQARQAKELMTAGLALLDPQRFDLRGDLSFGQDVMIDVNVVMEGNVQIGSDVFIGANCVLKNVVIGDGATIQPFSHLEKTHVGANCQVGPFARCRSGTYLYDDVKIGNFVETKKARIGQQSKVNHLSYVGDADIGEEVNIGAGTIFCNYDGVNKHKTTIGDQVFVGSNCALVAPVVLGKKATIGAGSVIVKDAPENRLTVARAKQSTVSQWKRQGQKTDTKPVSSDNESGHAEGDNHSEVAKNGDPAQQGMPSSHAQNAVEHHEPVQDSVETTLLSEPASSIETSLSSEPENQSPELSTPTEEKNEQQENVHPETHLESAQKEQGNVPPLSEQ